MKKSLTGLLTGLSLLAGSVFAGELVYPSDSPVLSITFPDSWKTEADGEVMHTSPADESVYLGLWALAEDQDVNDAIDALDQVVGELVKDAEFADAVENNINGIDIYSVDGTGKDDEGNNVTVSAAVFTPDGKQTFIILYYATPESEKKHEKDILSVLGSLKKASK